MPAGPVPERDASPSFGGVDGLTMFLGLALGLIASRQGSSAVWHAALGGQPGS